MYQTLLAEPEIRVHVENGRNATSCPVCGKKLSSLQTFFFIQKGFAIPAMLFLYYNWTLSFLLLTSVEESMDLEGE